MTIDLGWRIDDAEEHDTDGAEEVARVTVEGREALLVKTHDVKTYCTVKMDVSGTAVIDVTTSMDSIGSFGKVCPTAEKAAKIVAARLPG